MKRGLILLLFLLCCSRLWAQFSVVLHYETIHQSAEQIIHRMKWKKQYPSLAAIEQDLKELSHRMYGDNFTAFSVDSLVNEASIYHAYLYIGNPYLIQEIEVEGIPLAFEGEIKSGTPPFSVAEVDTYCARWLDFLENHGYPFASLEWKDVVVGEVGYKALIQLDTQSYIQWDSIIVKGNAKLSRRFLSGFLQIKNGKPYQEQIVRQLPALLQELPYIEETQPASISFGPDKAALYLYLKKRNVNQFDGVLGLIPATDKSGKSLLSGNIKLLLHNALTLGENISLQWNNPDYLSQNLVIAFRFPYLFGSRFGLSMDFQLEKKDTTYLQLLFSPALQYYFKGSNYLSFFYRYHNTRLIATEHLSASLQLPDPLDVDVHLYGLEVFYRRLDYLYNPRKGYSLQANAAIGQRTLLENTHIPAELYKDIDRQSMQLSTKVDVSLYVPIRKRWTAVFRVQSAAVYSEELFENELFRIGGLKTLRGFIDQSIYASTYAIFSTELRFLFYKKSFLQAFFDGGWYEKKSFGSYLNDRPFGFGLGIAFDTKAGMFSLNYALGKQFDNPISLKTGVVSFGYIALF